MNCNYEMIVRGTVQGVGFRHFIKTKALELSVTGFVKNTPEGHVQIVVEGEETDLKTLADWARIGPPLARVTVVHISRSDFTGEWSNFSIRF